MTTEKMQRIYEHFGITVEDIPLQKQVRQDIHDILIKLGACKVQTPNCVAISTENGIHKIINYPFNFTPNRWGQYEYRICLEIKTDYKIEELEKLVKKQVDLILSK